MGNIESQNGDHSLYFETENHLSHKHMSHSLRISNKHSRRPHNISSGITEHHGSEASTRSSSTPSIPQSLSENGLEPFNETDALSGHVWVEPVGVNLRPISFHDQTGKQSTTPGSEDGGETVVDDGQDDNGLVETENRHMEKVNDRPGEGGSLKNKKRSKSADMWREDSLEFSLSDLSQEQLTSTEEIVHNTEPENEKLNRGHEGHTGERTNSLDELCTQKTSTNRGSRNRYKYRRESKRSPVGKITNSMLSPGEEEGSGYGAYTLPCRRSHCLSERPPNQQGALCSSMQGRRAQTSHDITAGEDSEYGDSGIDGVTVDAKPQSRRCKAMSASFSVYSAASARSSSGSSSGGGGDRERRLGEGQGVYENFRQELELNSRQTFESLEEAGSAVSDERSSGTASSAFLSEALFLETTQGTVRKAGALAVKNFLVHKKNKKVEPATKRKWKHYWVSLKGCTLFLYETDGRSGIDHNSIPKHAVWAENSIVQAVPEHPKKDFVFCLSNSLGDAFLFQTSGQTELENWITAIHSACATAVARQHHREDTVRFLRAEIKKLEQKIDMDEKMKKMGDMQLSAVTDSKKRKAILEQIFLWEQNLEQFHVDLFRFRCYLSSLQGGELPNPKRLLAFASRPTKLAMGRLGIFSVSSFHALVAARTESGVRRRTHALSRSSSKRKSRFSSLWGLDTTSKKKSKSRPSISQVFVDGEEPVKKSLDEMFGDPSKEILDQTGSMRSLPQQAVDSDVWVTEYLTPSWVILPNDQPVLAIIQPGETTLEALESLCKAHSLDRAKHYLRLKFLIDNQVQFYVPKPEEELWDLLYKEIEVCSKTTKVIQFDRNESCAIGYGFSVVVVDEDGTQQLHITNVKASGMAFTKGLRAGDEILQLNEKQASVLELSDLSAAFAHPSLMLTISAVPSSEPCQRCLLLPRRSDTPHNLCTDIFSQSQGSDLQLPLEDILDEASIIVLESPDTEEVEEGVLLPVEDAVDGTEADLETVSEHKSTEQMTAFCRSLHDMNSPEPVAYSPSSSSSSCAPSPVSPVPVPSTLRQLSDADKLRKVISELVDTERTYVKDLHFVIERYRTPLQKEHFLSQDELDVLFGNLPEMVEFQVEFLKTLEDGTRLVPDLDKLERVDQFKKVLFSLGGSFLYYADRFKIYSAFCASHTKVPKVLTKAKTDPEFKAFLAKRNPRQQHSSTLESYLIKPIQRVLKYPLLLRELYCLTDPDSEEHYHLNVAMNAMNKVASHINEMQKIHEEYGAVFDQLISEQSTDKKEVADLSMGDLLLHATVVWINPPSSLMKGKKDPELAAFVFKTAIVFVYKDCSKQKKKIGTSHKGFVSDERDPFRFRHMIPSDALQVRNTTNSDGTAVCEIVHIRSESEGRPERTFHLCCSSSESKRDFLKTVHSVLRDKQRRQLLKTESLPHSQQYIPFGGKRFFALKGVRPINRAVSAPPGNLGRKRLVRNRFTINTDIVFDNCTSQDSTVFPQRDHVSPSQNNHRTDGDTDHWVEEQFDLQLYDRQTDVKETDILSDDDEYCESVKGSSAEPSLEESFEALIAEVEEEQKNEDKKDKDIAPSKGSENKLPEKSLGHLRLTPLRKQCAVEDNVPQREVEVIWVRRDDFNGGCGTDIF
ncbi:rho guanine nucleotide exchange factor TIAM1 isoform X1 [Silurus meridionalis]|uniref:rho guanine nucleotide exchange factor TIAM1 isoform X1 n=2 Tax=Silurus meridionalis TaxID=175797 RepID=UPI001EEB58CE|nr:rho guanine nucleotide exchange factor TIAM1 isoform X1 [Silurus meridionalis]XP_046716929.1 rho guanine nucleotide exchange factor TIAM1 isoform X1 [Silurus meridionalis]